MRILKPTQLSADDISHISSIEAQSYPGFMCQFDEIESIDDIYDYCESDDVSIVIFDEGYMIFTEDEIVDLCAIRPLSYRKVMELIRSIPSGTYSADLRQDTSLPLLRALSRRGSIQLQELSSWKWCDETMTEVLVTIL